MRLGPVWRAFLNSNEDWADEEILIAPDADELARRLSHALAEESGNGARIVLTEIDEERALTPWASLADDGFEIEFCPVKRPRAGLDVEQIRSRLTDATSAVVVPKACAAAGTVIELLPIVLELQSRPGSMVIDWTSFSTARGCRRSFSPVRLLLGEHEIVLWGGRRVSVGKEGSHGGAATRPSGVFPRARHRHEATRRAVGRAAPRRGAGHPLTRNAASTVRGLRSAAADATRDAIHPALRAFPHRLGAPAARVHTWSTRFRDR